MKKLWAAIKGFFGFREHEPWGDRADWTAEDWNAAQVSTLARDTSPSPVDYLNRQQYEDALDMGEADGIRRQMGKLLREESATPDVRVSYHGEECRVVLGPPTFVEQENGALLGSGMPTINLADPETGALRSGLTVEIPEAPLGPGQILVGGKDEGLRALTEAGVIRHTGEYYHSPEHGATFAVCDFLGLPEPQKMTLAALLQSADERHTQVLTRAIAEVKLVIENGYYDQYETDGFVASHHYSELGRSYKLQHLEQSIDWKGYVAQGLHPDAPVAIMANAVDGKPLELWADNTPSEIERRDGKTSLVELLRQPASELKVVERQPGIDHEIER